MAGSLTEEPVVRSPENITKSIPWLLISVTSSLRITWLIPLLEPRLSQVTINFQGSWAKPVEENAVRKRTAKINFTGIVFLIPHSSLTNIFASKLNVVVYCTQVILAYLLVLYTNRPYDHRFRWGYWNLWCRLRRQNWCHRVDNCPVILCCLRCYWSG